MKIKIICYFTEAGHGKSPADGVGGNIKNAAQEKQNMPDLVINNAESVKANIETSIELSIRTKDDIQKVTESMKEKIGTLVGATEIHELQFEPNGKIMKKNMPSEAFYKPVSIKLVRTINRKDRHDLNPGFIDEVIEVEETEIEPEPEPRGRRQILRTRNRRAIVYDFLADL